MQKAKLKYILHATTLVSFIVLIISGLIMEFLDKNQYGIWEGIHYVVGAIILIALIIYAIMWWDVFVGMTKDFFGKKKETNEPVSNAGENKEVE